MRTFDRHSPLRRVLENDDAARRIREQAPEFSASAVEQFRDFPFGPILALVLGASDPRTEALVAAISELEDATPVPHEVPPIHPNRNFEPAEVPRGSSLVKIPSNAEAYSRADIEFAGPSHGNPFVDVELSASFESEGQIIRSGGFYDGDGRYVIRFLPPAAGSWKFVTTSTARSLDGISGALEVQAGHGPGPARVTEDGHFAFADGAPFVPVGTTAYVWTHQPLPLEEQTLSTLANSPFNKLRMCLFPKHFLFNSNEPERFVFPRSKDGGWDTTRFDVDYFAHLERRVEELGRIGVQAELILFHPYDRWGFLDLGRAADDRYLRYVVRRLAAFPNVWWSMANEYDLILSKRREDWDRLGRLVRAEDHVGHPTSIHNWIELFDHSADWVTHCSIQGGDERIGEKIEEWTREWGKPVIIDEFGYEGDIDQNWGNLTAETVVQRYWDGMIRGGYLTHGETFWAADDVLWWSKGGTLKGESPARIEFLKRIVSESPSGRLDPLRSDWDYPWGGVPGRYMVLYFGSHRPRSRDVTIPTGVTVEVDVIDTWNMTVEKLPGIHSGRVHVALPARPYIAIRLRSIT
jgi:hypothetical protein